MFLHFANFPLSLYGIIGGKVSSVLILLNSGLEVVFCGFKNYFSFALQLHGIYDGGEMVGL